MAKTTARKKRSTKKTSRAKAKRSTNRGSRSPAELAYDAAESNTQRQQPSITLKSTDNLLTPTKRKRLQSKARHLQENFSIAAWAIRRHLDYVSSFSFQAQTGNPALDFELEQLVEWYSRADNCDVTGRHTLPRLIRLAEERRTVDGDVFLVKLSNGRLQAIEGDRVRDPERANGNATSRVRWVHGVRLGASGRPRSIAVHKRTDRGTYEHERNVPARNFYQLGYYDRFDQVRGVSPLAPAIKTFQDVYEGFDFALAKMKVAQLLGLVFYREAAEPVTLPSATSDDEAPTDPAGNSYAIDFGKGPIALDLDPGDKAEFIEPKTPPAEFQNFSTVMIAAALKSLDIPLSMYDEAHTNYSGARSALIHYQRSVKTKADHLREILNRITGWRIRMAIAEGDLLVPAGASLRFDWIPAGVPWFDPTKEIAGDIAAINAGLTTRSQVIKERHGRDFRDVIDQLASEQEYINAAGLVLNETQFETADNPSEEIDE